MADTIKVTTTLAKLDKEITNADPFVVGMPGNKRLIFEDFMAWDGDKEDAANRLADVVLGGADLSLDELAELWLDKAGFKVWAEARMSLRQKATILNQAGQFIRKGLEPGESTAS